MVRLLYLVLMSERQKIFEALMQPDKADRDELAHRFIGQTKAFEKSKGKARPKA